MRKKRHTVQVKASALRILHIRNIIHSPEQSYSQLNLYQFRQVTGSLVKQHKWYKWEQLNQKLKQEHVTVAAPPELRPLWLPCPCTRLTHSISIHTFRFTALGEAVPSIETLSGGDRSCKVQSPGTRS